MLASILGILGSLFGGKGKKTEYAAQQTPQQSQAYNALLKMLQSRMGQPSAGYGPTSMAMNQLSNMFYGQNAVPGVQPGGLPPQGGQGGGGGGYIPQGGGGGMGGGMPGGGMQALLAQMLQRRQGQQQVL